MESTDRLSLPLLVPGQAQKELSHNEALQLLDVVVAAAVEEPARNDPPSAPNPGQCYIVGDTPSGDWSQHGGQLAAFTGAGWRFVAPAIGASVLVKTLGTSATYGVGGWELGTIRADRVMVDGNQVVGARSAAVADPAGGTVIDAEARAALIGILSALRQHGLISA